MPEGIAIEIKSNKKRCRAKTPGTPRKRPVTLDWGSPAILETLSKFSYLSNRDLAKKLGVSEWAFYEYTKDDKSIASKTLASARANATEQHDNEVESAFYLAATGRLPKKVTKHNNGDVSFEFIYSDDANKRWLYNRRSSKWKPVASDGNGATENEDTCNRIKKFFNDFEGKPAEIDEAQSVDNGGGKNEGQ